MFQEGKAAKMRCELRRVLGVRLGAGGGERRNKPSAFPRVAAALHRRRPAGRAAGELRSPPAARRRSPCPNPPPPAAPGLPPLQLSALGPRRAPLAPGASPRALSLLSFLTQIRPGGTNCMQRSNLLNRTIISNYLPSLCIRTVHLHF